MVDNTVEVRIFQTEFVDLQKREWVGPRVVKENVFFSFRVFFMEIFFFFLASNFSTFEDLTYSYYRLMMLFKIHTFLLD